jgi:hypothetical protein
MALDRVFLDFLTCAATGAASVLLVILILGISIPRRAPVSARRNPR